MDKKARGAWLVHHTQKLDVVTPVLQFENIAAAGKAGILLSGLAATKEEDLTSAQTRAITRAAGLSNLEVPELLRHLRARRLIIDTTRGIHVMGVTTAAVLEHTSDIFDDLTPSPLESAALEVAEEVSERPIEHNLLLEKVSDAHKLATPQAKAVLQDSVSVGFVDRESLDSGRAIYFNGNLFRRGSPKKLAAVFESLSTEDSRKVRELEDLLKNEGCVERDQALQIVGAATFEKLHSIGMFDVNRIANAQESVYYVTRPAAFAKYGDAFIDDALDLTKAFVTCLTYGMTRSASSRGKIRMLAALLRNLIAGHWVGPATAIGEDYKVLELKRVLEVRPAKDGMFLMRLLKKEVGELALQVLTTGDASEQSLPLPGAAATSYGHPEGSRTVVRKKQTEASRRAMADILTDLRTGAS